MGFAENFKRICEEKGTSPTRVCLELGLSSSKVNLWNKGGIPKGDVMVKLAQKLDCTVMDFFTEEPVHRDAVDLDDDEKDIIRVFRMLTRPQKHAFMAEAYIFEKKLLAERRGE